MSGGYPGFMDIDTVLGWRGKTVLDRDGEKVGSLGDVYLDDETDRPAYAGVRTGLFGRNESIVPLEGMRESDGDLVVPYEKSLVDEAPNLDPDASLTAEEQEAVFAHYGRQRERDKGDPFEEGIVRSEEDVSVTAGEMQPAERVRLRKVLVTEDVKTTVPRRKEVVQLETDPAPEGTVERVEEADPDDRPGERTA
jgi:sporulation protein YlmC with PRC-barrel domain